MKSNLDIFLHNQFGKRLIENEGIDWNYNESIDPDEKFIDWDKNGQVDDVEKCMSIEMHKKQFLFEAGSKTYAQFSRLWDVAAKTKWNKKTEHDSSPAIAENHNKDAERVQEKFFYEEKVTLPKDITAGTVERLKPILELMTKFPALNILNSSLAEIERSLDLLEKIEQFSPSLAQVAKQIYYYTPKNLPKLLKNIEAYPDELKDMNLWSLKLYGFALPDERKAIFLNLFPNLFTIYEFGSFDTLANDIVVAHEAAHLYHSKLVDKTAEMLELNWNAIKDIAPELALTVNTRMWQSISKAINPIPSHTNVDSDPYLKAIIKAQNDIIRESFNYKWFEITREMADVLNITDNCIQYVNGTVRGFAEQLLMFSDIASQFFSFDVTDIQSINYLGVPLFVPSPRLEKEINEQPLLIKWIFQSKLAEWKMASNFLDYCIIRGFQSLANCTDEDPFTLCTKWTAAKNTSSFGFTTPPALGDISEDVAYLVEYIYTNDKPPYTYDIIHNYIIAKKVNLLVDEGFIPEKYRQQVEFPN